MTVKTGNPTTDAMFVELAKLTRECIDVPNEYLPSWLRDDRSKTTSLQYIHTHYEDLFEKPASEHAKLKAEKARRVAAYAAQWGDSAPDAEVEIQYEVDENLLYNRELNFCAAAVRAGWMEFDDED
jgi:hypothetical protein